MFIKKIFSSRHISLILLCNVIASCGDGSEGQNTSTQQSPLPGLTSLVVNGIQLDQVFQSTQLNYTARATYLEDFLELSASPTDTDSRLLINGVEVASGGANLIKLNEGLNTIVMSVQSSDGTKNYTLDITRDSATSFTQREFLTASNIGDNDRFGTSIAITGNYMVVGANGEGANGSASSDNSLIGAGAVYVYALENGIWSEVQYLKASNPGERDNFGASVAIHGDTIVVGAPGEASDGSSQSNDDFLGAGAVYVFRLTNGSWIQEQYLKASSPDASDKFGASVAIFEDTILIGASDEDSDGSSSTNNASRDTGAAYIFERNNDTWSQVQYLKPSNIGLGAPRFGSSVSIYGSLCAISARLENSGSSGGVNLDVPHSGAVYVFSKINGNWVEEQLIKASNLDESDAFGDVVSIWGNNLAVSATNEDGDGSNEMDNSETTAGAVYVFTRTNTGVWVQEQYIKASDAKSGDLFGISMALENNWLAVGAWNHGTESTPTTPENTGSVYLFEKVENQWLQRKRISADIPEYFGLFGSSVDIDIENGNLAVGEKRRGNDSGSAYIIR